MKSSRLFKWKNFRNHISETCKLNYTCDRFTDMTFIVQKRRITAHKIILSANSEFFKMILNESPSYLHPTITLPDVNYEDLDAIMKFIYTGELLVHPDRLESVLSLASCFQVKSLMKVQAALIKENDGAETVGERMCDVQDIVASSSQNEPMLAPTDIKQDPDSKVTHSQKTQRKKKLKEHFKNLVVNERVGEPSSSTSTGEMKMKRGKKCGVSRSEILTIGGKSNGLALTTKSRRRSNHRCIKEKLLKAFERGGTIKEVSKLYNISPSGAFYYKKCFVKAGKLSPSLINYQKKRLNASNRNKKVAENMPQTIPLPAEVKQEDHRTKKKLQKEHCFSHGETSMERI